MKTRKRFVISGMFKTLNILGICLMVGALFAPIAHALTTITIDPGTPGEGAQDFDFGAIDLSDSLLVQVVFAGNKTIKWDAGSHFFQSPGTPGTSYLGFFLDENLEPITTAVFAGRTASGGGGLKLPVAFASLEQDGVFRGMLFDFSGGSDVANFDWKWASNDRPLVGQIEASGNQPPDAEAGAPVTGTVDVSVTFDGSASFDPEGSPLQYDWEFGDGRDPLIDGGPTPIYTYTAADTYNVILTVTDEDGLTNSDTTTATIGAASQPPTAHAGGPYQGTAGVEVFFVGTASSDPEGSPLQYDWDFGDDSAPLINGGPTPSHTYEFSGEYEVVLTVTDNDKETDSDTTNATIAIPNQPPIAEAGGPYAGTEGEAVDFDGSLSFDPEEKPLARYDWYFGDGFIALDAGPAPIHTYEAPGLYRVTLTVTDDGGLPDSDSTTALIGKSSIPPTADANGPYNGQVGVALSFDGIASFDPDGSSLQYDWDFGDGSPPLIDAGPTPTHTYKATRKYIVKLTVTDESGETDTDKTVATIGKGNLPPQADAGDLVNGRVRRAITFDGTGSSDPDGIVVSYAWEFGDDETGTGRTPTHRYEEPGTYFVTLTVTDSDGATNSDATLVVINSRFECVEECRADKFECLDAADAARETCIEECGDDRICKRACRADARAEKTICRGDFRACRAVCR